MKETGIREALRRSELFLGFDDTDLSKIADLPSCRAESYQSKQVVFKKGDYAQYLFVLKKGRVDLMMEVPTSSLLCLPPGSL